MACSLSSKTSLLQADRIQVFGGSDSPNLGSNTPGWDLPNEIVLDHGSSLLRGTHEDVPWLGTFGRSSGTLVTLAGSSQLPGNLADSRIPLENLASLSLWQMLDDGALP